jgi:hypothetical protein
VIAVLDACVLFPMYLRDTLLRCAEIGLFEPRWSASILRELRAALASRVGVTAARRVTATRSDAFPEAATPVPRALVVRMTNHSGDHHVLAAAVAAHAGVIITDNVRHFAPQACAPLGVRIVTADQFLVGLLRHEPVGVVRILRCQASDYDHPPMSLAELLARLETSVPRFAGLADVEATRRR